MTHPSRRAAAPAPSDEAAPIGELKICGLAAVRARFERDPGSILRVYFDLATSRRIGAMSKALAAAHKIYRCVEPAELEKVAGSVHHGGIVAVVPALLPRPVRPEDIAAWAARRETLLILDRIGNAHNLGALARSAAFFGIPRLVLTADPIAARPNDAAYRVAEGGLEELEVRAVSRLPPFLRDLAGAGYEVIGAATRGGPALRASKGEAKPLTAIVLGNEESGMAPEVAAACTRLVTIGARGKVESLNVSVAGAVLMWEFIGRKSAK
jgi:RNA methyltransferase, TrmH family